MATETEVMGQETQQTSGETHQSEAHETASQNQTLEEMVREEQEKRAESDSESESERVDRTDRRQPNRLSAQERIRQLNEQKKAAEQRAKEAEQKVALIKSEMQSEVEQLRAEIARINQLVASGQISKSEGARAAKEAKIDFTKAIEDMVVPEELEPYKKDIAKIAMTIADSAIRPFREKFQQIEAERKEAEKQRYQAELERFQEEVFSNYSSVAQDFPELFTTSEDGQLPELKPEYDARAVEIANLFNIPFRNESGEEVFYNPLLSTREGLYMLMQYLSKETDSTRKAKQSIDRTKEVVSLAKKNRVESPDSMQGTPAKKQSLLEIVETTMKQFR